MPISFRKKKKTQDGPVYLTSTSKGNSLPAGIFRELWLLEGTWRLKVELKISVLPRPWLLQQQHLDCEWPLKIKRGGPSGVVGCFRLPGTLEQLWRILDDDDWWGKKTNLFLQAEGPQWQKMNRNQNSWRITSITGEKKKWSKSQIS